MSERLTLGDKSFDVKLRRSVTILRLLLGMMNSKVHILKHWTEE